MPKNTHLLYHPYKALEHVQELGLIPVRLFRVLYPLWRVRVEGRQRQKTEWDELEWFIERGIHEGGLRSSTALSEFFGLETDFVAMLLTRAREAGHLSGDEGVLSLTTAGLDSLRERVRYEERKLDNLLYFEALGNLPLTLEHDKVPILEQLPPVGETPFQAFYHFDQTWNTDALERLRENPEPGLPRLPEDIGKTELDSPQPVYLPVYFVEAREDKPNPRFSLLAFSQVRGLRDTTLEYAVNRDPQVFRALAARADSRADAVERYFKQMGLRKDDWYLNEDGPWGAQVMLAGEVFRPAGEDEDESPRLTVRNAGRYHVIYDWCLWLMCDDPKIRARAAAEQALEWLQYANIRPSEFEFRQKVSDLSQRLRVDAPPLSDLLALAQRRKMTRAAARLAEMEAD
jgi:hypothetical protein